jgi:hypothetical protein
MKFWINMLMCISLLIIIIFAFIGSIFSYKEWKNIELESEKSIEKIQEKFIYKNSRDDK